MKITTENSHDSLSVSWTTTDSNDNTHTVSTSSGAPKTSNQSEYILKASKHINSGMQHENEKNYKEAFAEYKAGIEILLKNIKGLFYLLSKIYLKII